VACTHPHSTGRRSPSGRVVVATCAACGSWLIDVDGEIVARGDDVVTELIGAMDDIGERVDGVASRELREFAASFTAAHGQHGERSSPNV
jgi:hypothetical protein